MKKICLPLLAAGALLGLSTAAQAAPQQPYHATTVRWVVNSRDNLSVDDRYVTLVGHVTRRIGDEEYWFTDGTGSVRLDSENFDLPVGARIVVGGRIDQAYLGFGHLEVDVRHRAQRSSEKAPRRQTGRDRRRQPGARACPDSGARTRPGGELRARDSGFRPGQLFLFPDSSGGHQRLDELRPDCGDQRRSAYRPSTKISRVIPRIAAGRKSRG